MLSSVPESFATDGPSRMRLMNILMQLRKCVNHPYLFDGESFCGKSFRFKALKICQLTST